LKNKVVLPVTMCAKNEKIQLNQFCFHYNRRDVNAKSS